jgi:TonB-linked SusC/RagA family outer membrane protein
MSACRTFVVAFLILLSISATVEAQRRVITGRVTDETSSAPLAGANIQLLGTNQGVFAGPDGRFSISAPPSDVTLRISLIGHKRRDILVRAAAAGPIQVALETDVLNLDEIVVTGQATGVSRRNLANSVAKVNAEQLTKTPTASFQQALSGKIAGADIQTNSGAPGGGLQVRMRGVSSILGNANPLYVVDGVIVSDAQIPSGVHVITRSSTNPATGGPQDNSMNRISDLNPNDIESIEVLKGASAAAIYGSKANNGVIVITTKRGKSGAPQFSLSQRFGTFVLSNTLGLRRFNTLEEAVATFGPRAADHWAADKFFDHDRELAGEKPLAYETTASVSGGTESTRYYASGLVKHDGGIIKRTFYDKQSLKLNIDQSIGSRMSITLSSTATHTKADRGLTQNDNNSTSYYMTMPSIPSFFDMRKRDDGTWPVVPFTNSNVLQTAELLQNLEEVNRFIASGGVTLDAFSSGAHSLRLMTNAGADYFNQENTLFAPPELQFEPLDGLPGTSILGNANSMFLNLNTNLVHVLRPSGGKLTATTSVGSQTEYRDLDQGTIIQRNLIAGLQNVERGTAPEVRQNRQTSKDFGIFAQEEVLWNERLLLTLGIRADKSSNNSDVDAFHTYPKAAASYRFADLRPGLLDELKVRAAWGQSGNQPLYGMKFTEYNATNIEGLAAVEVQGQFAAPDIRPEQQTEVEGGIDATLFDSRATLGVTIYEKRIKDLLLRRELASSSGFARSIFNGGLLRTRGVEAELMVVPIRNESFQWTSQTTFSADRGKLLELPVPQFQTGGFGFAFGTYLAQEGEPLTQMWGNITNPDGTRTLGKVADGNPEFRMGFSNDFRFKGLSLSSLWNWQQGGAIVNLTKYLYDLRRNGADCGAIVDGQEVCAKRFAEFPGNTLIYLEDATFWKLRELTLTFELPEGMAKKLVSSARYARLSVSARNLITITDYTGMDPEVSNFGNQAIARNIDVAPYPPSRNFWISLDLGL